MKTIRLVVEAGVLGRGAFRASRIVKVEAGMLDDIIKVMMHPQCGWLDGCEPSQRRP